MTDKPSEYTEQAEEAAKQAQGKADELKQKVEETGEEAKGKFEQVKEKVTEKLGLGKKE